MEARQCVLHWVFPLTEVKLDEDERVPPEGTFRWVLTQDGLEAFIKGHVYTDASRIHEYHPDTMRLGWAFVVLVLANSNTWWRWPAVRHRTTSTIFQEPKAGHWCKPRQWPYQEQPSKVNANCASTRCVLAVNGLVRLAGRWRES